MNVSVLDRQPIPDELLNLLMPMQSDGTRQLVAVPAQDLAQFKQPLLSLFCLINAIYQLPTVELIDWLEETIGDRTAIEIGAGVGAVGRELGIRMTDSYLQDGTNKAVAEYYAKVQQPMIQYPKDVIKLPALTAVAGMRPQVILGCWVTHKSTPANNWTGNMWGIEEDKFKGLAEQYIVVGNHKTHGDKPILRQFPHKVYQFDWLYSRSLSKDQNAIWVFDL